MLSLLEKRTRVRPGKGTSEQNQVQAPEIAHYLHNCPTKPASGSALSTFGSFARNVLVKRSYRSSGRKEGISCERLLTRCTTTTTNSTWNSTWAPGLEPTS